MEAGMSSKLTKAIKGMKTVTFNYKGKERTVDPYCFGMGNSSNSLLRGYQHEGEHNGIRSNPCWSLFKLEDIRDLEVTREEFTRRRDFKRRDSAFRTIMFEVGQNV